MATWDDRARSCFGENYQAAVALAEERIAIMDTMVVPRSFFEAFKDMSSSQGYQIMKVIGNYFFEGIDIEKSKLTRTTKALIKHILLPLFNEKEEEKARKRGGQPGNTNARKIPELPPTETNQNESDLHDHDHSLHSLIYNHDHEIQLLEKITSASAKLGVSIEKPEHLIKKFRGYGVKIEWFVNTDYTIFDYIVVYLKKDPKYKYKTGDEMRCLFISAIQWPDIQREYPVWREKQEDEAVKKQKKALRESYPTVCPQCSAPMQGNQCPNCRGFFTFSEAEMKHIFNPALPYQDINCQFLNRIKKREESKNIVVDDEEKEAG
jgi:hypothetical protein